MSEKRQTPSPSDPEEVWVRGELRQSWRDGNAGQQWVAFGHQGLWVRDGDIQRMGHPRLPTIHCDTPFGPFDCDPNKRTSEEAVAVAQRCEECNAEGGPTGVLLSQFLTDTRWRCYDQSACLRRRLLPKASSERTANPKDAQTAAEQTRDEIMASLGTLVRSHDFFWRKAEELDKRMAEQPANPNPHYTTEDWDPRFDCDLPCKNNLMVCGKHHVAMRNFIAGVQQRERMAERKDDEGEDEFSVYDKGRDDALREAAELLEGRADHLDDPKKEPDRPAREAAELFRVAAISIRRLRTPPPTPEGK